MPAKHVEGSLGDYIAANRFAYSLRSAMHTGMAPPPLRLTLDVFPQTISHLFETAFDVKPLRRPRAKDWIDALENLAKLLRQCSAKKRTTTRAVIRNAFGVILTKTISRTCMYQQ